MNTISDTLLVANTYIQHLAWKPELALFYATLGGTNITLESKTPTVKIGETEYPVSLENGVWVRGWI